MHRLYGLPGQDALEGTPSVRAGYIHRACVRCCRSFQPVSPHADVQLLAGETEGLGGLGFVEARILQRLLHHRALDRLQMVCGHWQGGS